ncbi:MAG: FG-GAP-like repeat-containing protein [Pyrinomonadaceae bacterium]
MRRNNLFKSFRFLTERRKERQFTDSRFVWAVTSLSLVVVAVTALTLIRQAVTAQAQESTEISEAASLFEANAATARQTTKPEAKEQSEINNYSEDTAPLSPEGSVCGWTSSTVYPVTILDQATASVGGNLYSFGGVSTAIIASAYKFDGTVWTPIAPLPAALEFPTAVSDGTNIFILGGALVGTGTPQTTVYRYNIATNDYTTLTPFTIGTWNAAAVYQGGKIYKFTGTGPATASTNVLEIYDIAGNTWTTGAPYPLSISFVGAFEKGGFIYGAGGIQSVGSVASLKTYRYDPVGNTWDDAAITDLPATRWAAASSITGYGVNNGWVLAGGYVNGTATANISNSTIRWNSTTNVWDALPNMVGERARMTGAILGSSFYVVGGRSIASSAFVGTNSNQKLLCTSGVAVITAGAATVTSGNNLLEPNECNTLNVPVSNAGDVGATVISAVLSTTTPGITVTQPNSPYPDIPPFGGPTNNTTPYQVSIDNTVACYTMANFTLTVTYTGGSSPSVTNFSLPVGIPSLNYVFASGAGAIPAGGTFIALSDDDDFVVSVPLPAAWTSTVYGTAVTSLSASTNGALTINGTSVTTLGNTALPGTTFTGGPTLFPYWDDLDMDVADVTGGGIFTNTVGTAPNREFYIEWRAQHFSETVNGPITTNFAILLTEGSDVVRYIYTSTGIGAQLNGASATVGMQAASTGTQFTQFSFNTASLSAGLQLTATRPPGVCTPGTGPCNVVPPKPRADFDGDGRTDLSVFRPSEGNWYLNRSTAGFSIIGWGISTDTLVPGDYDGDGKADTAVFRPDANSANPDYFVLNSNGFVYTGVSWGSPGDIPVNGDYDGDGKTDFAIFRPSTGTWYILNSIGSSNTIAPFGLSADIPLAIDNDGDGKTNLAAFRPSNNTWYVARPTGTPATNFDAYPFGTAGDKLVQADYDGDNKDDVAVFRPSNGTWYILRSTNGATDIRPFGASGDVPVPGDYDGDGSDDIAVYRNGIWYVNRSTAGLLIQPFGLGSDTPIPAKYIP